MNTPIMLIRPVQLHDLDGLFKLAHMAAPGMTNFPPHRTILEQKVQLSLQSFAKSVQSPHDEFYFFIMEECVSHTLVGCCGIYAKIGIRAPCFSYKLSREDLIGPSINLHSSTDILYLVNDYDHSSEIGMLYLMPKARENRQGELLSRCRFMFMANHMERFCEKVIAQMRGVISPDGHSIFWDALARKFFGFDFRQADRLAASGDKQFIVEVMPRLPIYVSLLPPEAQAVIGQVHPETRPALKFLDREGFSYEKYVDIFDAGPTIEAKLTAIRTIRKSKLGYIDQLVDKLDAPLYMVTNTEMDFRASITPLLITPDGGLTLSKAIATHLQVTQGNTLRFI